MYFLKIVHMFKLKKNPKKTFFLNKTFLSLKAGINMKHCSNCMLESSVIFFYTPGHHTHILECCAEKDSNSGMLNDCMLA